MDYSRTLNLPRTDFPMRANLVAREPVIEQLWDEIRLYEQSLDKPAPKGDFILHDGPPYSNGHIHMGHALNKVLKDIIIKYKSMSGYRCPYIPGWDNHGMPIEVEVSKEFRKTGKKPDRLELRRRCREYAAEWVDIQREEFSRLGVRGDWYNPYLTLSTGYEAAIIKVFAELALDGYIFRGLKPILWCPSCETALAEAEIEYQPHTSTSIFVRFPLKSDPHRVLGDLPADKVFAAIWTTTPWTIPANVALAVHPDYQYSIVQVSDVYYIIAEALVENVLSLLGINDYHIIRNIKGSDLAGTIFAHPIFDRDSVVVTASYVTLEDGTGIVHTAPGHGREDFDTGKKYGLPIINPVDSTGHFTDEAGQFAGMSLKEGQKAVLEELHKRGYLLRESTLDHSYPHCWRCRGPVIYRATVQWFLNLEHNNLRKRILDAINDVDWYPPESIHRITSMISGSPDWCLSRQRAWGVEIPVFYCTNCDSQIMTPESFDAVYKLVSSEGSDAWFEKDPSDILPEGFKCPVCAGTHFTKESDILDVWFDSGSSCRAVLEQRPELHYPADLYLEGSDQHRGWFNKSLVIGISTRDRSPFRQCVTNGWMLDEKGRTMHKSWGNVIAPKEIIDKDGADILRLWVASTNYFEDVKIGKEILKRVSDSYRRIRNTLRFLLANLYDFSPETDCIDYSDMMEIDRWALHRLQKLIGDVNVGYNDYEFHKVFHALNNFCAVDMSSFYLDVIKDRLYVSAASSQQRRSGQTALYEILSVLTRLITPVLSYTAEDVWQYIPGEDKELSVQLSDFPEVNTAFIDEELERRWNIILDVRESVFHHLEAARSSGVIGKPLEAGIIIKAPSELYETLDPYRDQLASIFIVSHVRLEQQEDDLPLEISIESAAGARCDRCWLVLPTVGGHAVHPTLCTRCTETVSNVY
ncbi:MAG: isoleucine--tRNA ligase [Armatimonadota bacterium]